MTYKRDNIDVPIGEYPGHWRDLKMYKDWLREQNIKFSIVNTPLHFAYPSHLNMRLIDAVAFKMKFKL